MDRRRFFQTAAGMAASFLAMNEVYGNLFDVSSAEAATPGAADERASELKDQFIMDMHTHFLRDDTRLDRFVRMREAVLAKYSGPQLLPRGRVCLPYVNDGRGHRGTFSCRRVRLGASCDAHRRGNHENGGGDAVARRNRGRCSDHSRSRRSRHDSDGTHNGGGNGDSRGSEPVVSPRSC